VPPDEPDIEPVPVEPVPELRFLVVPLVVPEPVVSDEPEPMLEPLPLPVVPLMPEVLLLPLPVPLPPVPAEPPPDCA